jgi:hypothetical protein
VLKPPVINRTATRTQANSATYHDERYIPVHLRLFTQPAAWLRVSGPHNSSKPHAISYNCATNAAHRAPQCLQAPGTPQQLHAPCNSCSPPPTQQQQQRQTRAPRSSSMPSAGPVNSGSSKQPVQRHHQQQQQAPCDTSSSSCSRRCSCKNHQHTTSSISSRNLHCASW